MTTTADKLGFDEILARFDGVKKTAGGWSARCPGHEDRVASLSIALKDDRILLCCHAGCETSAIVEGADLKMGDLFLRSNGESATPQRPQKSKAVWPSVEDYIASTETYLNGRHAGTWTYRNRDGTDAFQVLRFNVEEGKQFRPIHRNSDGWLAGDPAGKLPLYRCNAIDTTQPVIVVEGEKCTDALTAIGIENVVTWSHGAGSVHKSDWTVLADTPEVRILPDCDNAGRKASEDVATILHDRNPSVIIKIVQLDGLDEHGDVVDWIDAHDSTEDADLCDFFNSIVAKTSPWTPTAIESQSTESATQDSTDNATPRKRSIVRKVANVQPEPVTWLWRDRVACGKVTLLAGDPGLGKSFLSLDMASRVSTGRAWPDGLTEANPAGSVVILSAEDDVADTIRPRCDTAGADVSRIYVLEGVRTFDPDTDEPSQRCFSLERDIRILEETIQGIDDVRLIVIDPVTAYLGHIDSHKNAEVRGTIAPLSDLAGRYGVAVVCITHLNKSSTPNTLYRAMGSLAFVAAARSAWFIVQDKADPTHRLMMPGKNNLAPEVAGLSYTIRDEGYGPAVFWDAEPVAISTAEAMAEPSKPTKVDEAVTWLNQQLADLPRSASEIEQAAIDEDIASKTLRRASQKLRVVRTKDGVGGGWIWSLPTAKGGAR